MIGTPGVQQHVLGSQAVTRVCILCGCGGWGWGGNGGVGGGGWGEAYCNEWELTEKGARVAYDLWLRVRRS